MDVFALPIVFPMVAPDKSRIRVMMSAGLEKEDLDHALNAFEKAGSLWNNMIEIIIKCSKYFMKNSKYVVMEEKELELTPGVVIILILTFQTKILNKRLHIWLNFLKDIIRAGKKLRTL